MTLCSIPTGRFNDIYHDYKYTYYGCGIILMVASVFLFVGMGINYRLLDREKREEERLEKLADEDGDRAEKEKRDDDVNTPLKASKPDKMAEEAV